MVKGLQTPAAKPQPKPAAKPVAKPATYSWYVQFGSYSTRALAENAQKQIDSAFEQACVDAVAEKTVVDMPKALVEAELDNQMERVAYQLQMSGYSVEQYAKMMGGDMSNMRNAFRPAAEKQAKANVTLEKLIEVEGITVSDEEVEAEYAAVAQQYSLELDKVKEMVQAEEIQTSLKTRKAVKLIVENAVAVAPKAEEEKKPARKPRKKAVKKTEEPAEKTEE